MHEVGEIRRVGYQELKRPWEKSLCLMILHAQLITSDIGQRTIAISNLFSYEYFPPTRGSLTTDPLAKSMEMSDSLASGQGSSGCIQMRLCGGAGGDLIELFFHGFPRGGVSI